MDDVAFAVSGGPPDPPPPPPPPDLTAPVTSITSPANGTRVSGTVTVQVSASDNIGVTRVEVYLDGTTLIGSDTTSPYAVTFNSSSAKKGTHTLTSKAYDAAGNVGTSAPISISIR